MLIADGGRPDFLVVGFFYRSQYQALILADFGSGSQDLGVFIVIGSAPDNQWDVDGIRHLFHYRGGFIGRAVFPVGVGADELQTYHLRPLVLDALLAPGNRALD